MVEKCKRYTYRHMVDAKRYRIPVFHRMLNKYKHSLNRSKIYSLKIFNITSLVYGLYIRTIVTSSPDTVTSGRLKSAKTKKRTGSDYVKYLR